MKRIIALVSMLFVLTVVAAQNGAPLLTNFIQSKDVENQNWAICQDDDQVMLFANRKGILTFDGKDWLTIRIPTIPYTMQKNPADGRIYIGGDDNYGYLEKDETGSYKYLSLSGDSSGTGIITKIIFNDSLAWFYGEQSISRYNLKTHKHKLRLDSESGYPFTGMLITPKNTFINVMDKGLYRVESDTLFPIVTGYLTEKVDILFSLPYNKNLVLVGLSNGTLSFFDGIKYYDYPIKDNGYLRENILAEGIMLSDTTYAFSTLDGGAIVVEKLSGKLLYTINNQNELPDDEVFAIGSDNSGGLWLSHQYGLTRADLNLPVRNYSIFPGLKGNLSYALMSDNEFYVATSEGVFYLAQVKNYSEVEVLIKNEPASAAEAEKVSAGKDQYQQSSRKNIFARIFGKKTVQQKAPKTKEPAPVKPAAQFTRKTVSKLKSINFIYKRVDGLNEKCRQLVSTPYGILAATNKGLFVVDNHKAKLITTDRYINYISWQPADSNYFIAADDGYFSVKFMDGKWHTEELDPEFLKPVYSIFRENNKTIWLGSDNCAYKKQISDNSEGTKYSRYNVNKDFPERYILDLINDTVFLFTESEIDFYNRMEDRFDQYAPAKTSAGANENLFFPLSNYRLIRQNDKWISPESAKRVEEKELSLLKVFDDVVSVTVEDKNLWIIDGNNRLYGIDRLRYSKTNPVINVFIKSITNDRGISFDLRDVKFERGDNVIHFNIIAPDYLKQNTIQYQYFINKIMPDWSPWDTKTSYDKTITRPGDYILKVRAKDLWGNIGETRSITFTIKAPFTKTLLFYLLTGFSTLFLIILIVRFRERQLQNKNKLLEEKVKERTAEIAAQKEEITSSIEYASRIQMAMLPMEDHFKESFSDYFILFKPRDIVSGDFYWIGEDDKSIFLTVVDCTGHGVPGAFMSTMGIATLNEIIANKRDLQANIVLNLLREKTKMALHQTGKEGEAADGMDVAFCVLNKNRKILQFSGAFNPLLIVQDGELKEYKADRMPIGIHYGEEKSFTNFVISVSRGDTLYIFSDGFTSQFGGPKESKFKTSNLKKLLQEIYYRPMVEQRNILENEFAGWRGSEPQVDDITIIGVRI
ncbi:MAG: SpoIIE family protein phosphatase [Bacteroidia bacterium]|nr:SpoIIE family protein phosphatase [Bacteroidia bacterium]